MSRNRIRTMLDESSLECPFTWKPKSDISSERLIDITEEKILQVEDESGESAPWTKFILHMILCYEHYNSNKIDKALENEEECEKIINDSGTEDNAILAAKEAFKHVCLSSKFFLLEGSAEVLSGMIPVNEMNSKERATIWGIGSAVLMEYGPRNTEQSICFVKEALKLDPDCAEWHFLLGKVLRRRRRKTGVKTIPVDEELEALQLAVEKSNDPWYKVTLAQSLLEKWYSMYLCGMLRGSGSRDSMENMARKADQLYREALENCGDNPFVLQKCSEGFRKLPKPFKNTDLSRKCILRALEIAPIAKLYHEAAVQLHEVDVDRAKQYFTRAIENGNVGSCYYLLKIKYKENKLYNPCADIERYISLFTGNHHMEYFLCWLGAFHHFVKIDFNSALENWIKIFSINNRSYMLTEAHAPWDIRPPQFNISEIILKEIEDRIRNPTYDAEERNKYKEVLQDLAKHRPDLFQAHVSEMFP